MSKEDVGGSLLNKLFAQADMERCIKPLVLETWLHATIESRLLQDGIETQQGEMDSDPIAVGAFGAGQQDFSQIRRPSSKDLADFPT